jgi:hypothetical protein
MIMHENGALLHHDGIADTGDIVGYAIEAIDGEFGRVAKANNATASSALVVRTGPRFLARDVVLPASAIEYLDHEHRVAQLNWRTDEIRTAPRYGDASAGEARQPSRRGTHGAVGSGAR